MPFLYNRKLTVSLEYSNRTHNTPGGTHQIENLHSLGVTTLHFEQADLKATYSGLSCSFFRANISYVTRHAIEITYRARSAPYGASRFSSGSETSSESKRKARELLLLMLLLLSRPLFPLATSFSASPSILLFLGRPAGRSQL